MTERLRALLLEETEALPIPEPDVHRIMELGRKQARFPGRFPVTGLAAAAAVAAVVAGGIALMPDPAELTPTQRFNAISSATAFDEYGAFAVGSTVYVGNQRAQVDGAVKGLYYTSEGVLAWIGKTGDTNVDEPGRYVLVHPDGSTKEIPVEREGSYWPGTDPGSPFMTYAVPADPDAKLSDMELGEPGTMPSRTEGLDTIDRWDLIAVDLRTGKEAHRGTVTGAWGHGSGPWSAPLVSTRGTRMWAQTDDGYVEHDWSTGATRTTDDYPGDGAGNVQAAAAGRYVQYDPPGGEAPWDLVVRDAHSNAELARFAGTNSSDGLLSPDARVLRVGPEQVGERYPGPFRFLTVATGKVVELPQRAWGWTPDGDALVADPARDLVTRCDTETGSCVEIHLALPDGDVRGAGYVAELM